MQTQRDHVHAHTFMMGRLSSALVVGDPTGAEIPGRRAQTGLLIGVILALLVSGGFAVYGWIVPGGSKAYRQPGLILVEKESGDRYVYLDGLLHPTPDLTSAMLIQGPSAKVKLISRNSLKDVSRGAPLGVAGAPRQIPAAEAFVQGPWLVCLPGSVVSDRPVSGLGVNLDPGVTADSLPTDRFVVVEDRRGVAYLLAGGVKHRVDDEVVLVALGAANVDPIPVPDLWLGWLEDGSALAPARIEGAGAPGPRVGGRAHPVGTLFRQRVESGSEQLFVLRRDGLAPMSRTEFLLADAKDKSSPVEVGSAAIVDARRSADRSLLNRLPDLVPLRLQDPTGRAVCMRQRPVSAEEYVSEVVLAPKSAAAVSVDGKPLVLTHPGAGMLVVSVPAPPRTATPETSVISDDAVTYRLGDQVTMSALKIGQVAPVPFPRDLLAAMPQGPVLSRKAVTSLSRG
ncbi:type VII secretion protein EccB [Salinispora arenicola]|uniref:type VII secretion protein EccB n=1 Tax=Salinispora arenicola TaxID=168697 RepID=UPI000365DC70|nr:type VII secretion protein EccB [Salinispora arenicola]